MTSWREVRAALDEVAAQGRAVRVWWRDDDAGRDHPALARLLGLAERHGLPVALAVVPAWLDADARARIGASGRATVLQHGWAHVDHAPPGARPIELGACDPEEIGAELERGRSILIEAFGTGFQAVLVPPWNRIEPEVVSILPRLGYVGISTFGRRRAPEAVPGLVQVNTHLDPVDWRGTRLFVGEVAALAPLLQVAAVDEPFGILSHHLAMDEPGWRFLDRLLELVAHHPGVRFCAPGELFEAVA
jgi:peptidoglycan/xylan/chitin deacetylase (PgdA/CDA1 family)